jgi:PAS domain S-box-containing protein
MFRYRAVIDPKKEDLMDKFLRILMLEDNPADAELVTYQLRKGGLEFVSLRVETEEDFKRQLTEFEPDILLLDFELPTFDGLSALLISRSMVPGVPAIFVTGVMGEESAVDMLHRGATDYVLKDNLSRLVPAVERALSEAKELAKLRAAEEALRQSEQKYSQMFQNIHSGVAVYSAQDDGEDFIFVDFNEAAERIDGISREEVVGRSVLEVFPGVHRFGLFEVFQRVWKTGVPERHPEGHYADERISGWRDNYLYRLPSGELVVVYEDITERKAMEESLRASEERLAFTARLLSLLNQRMGKEDTIRQVLEAIKKFTGTEAVGIRLAEGEDFPYYLTNGFPAHFVRAEKNLCAKDEGGDIVRDPDGNPLLECMCGNVIQGRTDVSLPFFTANGSFWTNSTNELLASTTEADRQAHTRDRCHGEGYESVALVPLRSETVTIGLLQLNDRRKDMFDLETIEYFEGIAASIGIAIDRKNTLEALSESKEELQQLVDKSINAFALFESVFDDSGSFVSYRFLYFNEAYERITGVKNEEVRGKTVHEVWPGTEPEWIRRYGEVAVTGVAQTFDLFHEPTAKLYHCTVYRPWRTSERFCVVFEDVTERKAYEKAARLLSDTAVRFISVDSESLRKHLKRALEEIAALSGADRCFLLVGSYESGAIEYASEWYRDGLRPMIGDVKEYDLEPWTWIVKELESSRAIVFSFVDDLPPEAEVEKRAFQTDGIASLIGVPILPEGELGGFLGLTSETVPRRWSEADESLLKQAGNMLSNLLARIRAEEALRASEAYYQALLEQSIDCITVLDETGTIRYESPSVTQLLGYDRDELIGRNVFDYIHPDDAPAAVEAFTAGLGEPAGTGADMEVRFKHKDGSWRRFWGFGRTMLDDPAVRGIILNSRDVTDVTFGAPGNPRIDADDNPLS